MPKATQPVLDFTPEAFSGKMAGCAVGMGDTAERETALWSSQGLCLNTVLRPLCLGHSYSPCRSQRRSHFLREVFLKKTS